MKPHAEGTSSNKATKNKSSMRTAEGLLCIMIEKLSVTQILCTID
jgi:hypothetical protein